MLDCTLKLYEEIWFDEHRRKKSGEKLKMGKGQDIFVLMYFSQAQLLEIKSIHDLFQ